VGFTPSFGEADIEIRKMRGATQAHLVRLRDGSCCVVKFTNNPLGAGALVNELLSSLLLAELGIATPEPLVVRVDDGFINRNPQVLLCREGVPYPAVPGRHFGSRFPGDPDTTAVFDFMPDALLSLVVNRDNFLGALMFDVWTCNPARRQAIFYKAKGDRSAARGESAVQWFAQMIDHDRAFEGARLRFTQTLHQVLSEQRILHVRRPSIRDFAPWLERLMALPDRVFDGVLRSVPAEWLRGEERQARETLAWLRTRRDLVPALLGEILASLPEETGKKQA
jgi:hypothetical protein